MAIVESGPIMATLLDTEYRVPTKTAIMERVCISVVWVREYFYGSVEAFVRV